MFIPKNCYVRKFISYRFRNFYVGFIGNGIETRKSKIWQNRMRKEKYGIQKLSIGNVWKWFLFSFLFSSSLCFFISSVARENTSHWLAAVKYFYIKLIHAVTLLFNKIRLSFFFFWIIEKYYFSFWGKREPQNYFSEFQCLG